MICFIDIRLRIWKRCGAVIFPKTFSDVWYDFLLNARSFYEGKMARKNPNYLLLTDMWSPFTQEFLNIMYPPPPLFSSHPRENWEKRGNPINEGDRGHPHRQLPCWCGVVYGRFQQKHIRHFLAFYYFFTKFSYKGPPPGRNRSCTHAADDHEHSGGDWLKLKDDPETADGWRQILYCFNCIN